MSNTPFSTRQLPYTKNFLDATLEIVRKIAAQVNVSASQVEITKQECEAIAEQMNQPATQYALGSIIVGDDLQITPEGVLSVYKANDVEEDNTHPITAAAVYTEVGNIDELLKTI